MTSNRPVSEMVELKPCPFCGSTEIEQEETITDAAVICRNCGSRTGLVFLGASEASNAAKMREQRDLWNTRASDQAPSDDVVELGEHPLFEPICREIERLCPEVSAGMGSFLAARIILLVVEE